MTDKLTRYFFLLLFAPFLLVACSDEEEGGTNGNSSSDNTNSNITAAIPEAGRLEVPHLANGSQYMLLVHKSVDIGVNMIIEWDCKKKAQRWTAYQMYDKNTKGTWNRNNWQNTEWQGDPFQIDPLLPEKYRTELEDYRGTRYNRGHICPSADRLCSKNANEQTFYLSNMQPQIYDFNAGVWGNMENQLRKWNENRFRDTLFVCKGGTIAEGQTLDPGTLVPGSSMKLLVPKYFFMAILCKKNEGYKAIAFWAEHKADHSTKLTPYLISIDRLEELTGIDFFCNLPDNIENSVEKLCSLSSWGLQ